jgi:hypothetical protein
MADASGSATDSGCLFDNSRPETQGRFADPLGCFDALTQKDTSPPRGESWRVTRPSR